MAEGVPTNPVVLPGCCPALFMDRQATAVRNRAVLLTPDADASPALWTLHQAASRRTNVVLLDVRWLDDAQIRNGCRIAEFTFTIAPLTGSTLLDLKQPLFLDEAIQNGVEGWLQDAQGWVFAVEF